MFGSKTKLTGIITVLLSAALLTGCTTEKTPIYAPVPKTAKYGTGLQLNKTVQAQTADRQVVFGRILAAVGAFDTAEHQQLLEYDNVTATSFDLSANSPFFVNKQRTTVTCSAGKSLGTDIGEGFYVVGESFLLPTANHTLQLTKTRTQVTTAIKSAGAKNVVHTAEMGVDAYKFTLLGKQALTVRVYGKTSTVTGIRISLDLPSTTCYKLDGLPLTSAENVKTWRAQVNALQ